MGVGEAALKVKDLPAATAFCSAVHCSYADFEGALLPQLIKNATLSAPAPPKLGAPTVPPESDSERSARLGRKRSALRLLYELVGVGVLSDATPVILNLAFALIPSLRPSESESACSRTLRQVIHMPPQHTINVPLPSQGD